MLRGWLLLLLFVHNLLFEDFGRGTRAGAGNWLFVLFIDRANFGSDYVAFTSFSHFVFHVLAVLLNRLYRLKQYHVRLDGLNVVIIVSLFLKGPGARVKLFLELLLSLLVLTYQM